MKKTSPKKTLQKKPTKPTLKTSPESGIFWVFYCFFFNYSSYCLIHSLSNKLFKKKQGLISTLLIFGKLIAIKPTHFFKYVAIG